MLKKGGFRMSARLIEANEVIFFGHSLNPMDFSYFKSYFDYVAQTSSANQSLTFFCLDENNILSLDVNLR